MVTQEQINDLEARRAKLAEAINIEQREIDLRNEQERTEEPTFWDNPDKARQQLKRVADIKAVLDDYAAMCRAVEDLSLIPDFITEGVITEAEAEAQRIVSEARAEAERMIECARADGERLCTEAARETAAELAAMTEQIRIRAAEHTARMLEEADAEADALSERVKLTRRSAEKIVIRGLEAKCR